MKKMTAEEGDVEAGDEFCTFYPPPLPTTIKSKLTPPQAKSKKQRRLAAKRQRLLELKARESGNLDALIPKIPLQKQSINLPGTEGGDLVDAVAAADAREALRKAMRKDRKVTIKESNYLKSM